LRRSEAIEIGLAGEPEIDDSGEVWGEIKVVDR
jgi:hypothetical protein